MTEQTTRTRGGGQKPAEQEYRDLLAEIAAVLTIPVPIPGKSRTTRNEVYRARADFVRTVALGAVNMPAPDEAGILRRLVAADSACSTDLYTHADGAR